MHHIKVCAALADKRRKVEAHQERMRDREGLL